MTDDDLRNAMTALSRFAAFWYMELVVHAITEEMLAFPAEERDGWDEANTWAGLGPAGERRFVLGRALELGVLSLGWATSLSRRRRRCAGSSG